MLWAKGRTLILGSCFSHVENNSPEAGPSRERSKRGRGSNQTQTLGQGRSRFRPNILILTSLILGTRGGSCSALDADHRALLALGVPRLARE